MNQQPTTNNQQLFGGAFQRKRVWLSGHTGFKGSWMTQWLLELGAEVHGYALEPDTRPALFEQLKLNRQIEHEINDIRHAEKVGKSICSFRPNFIFHLAAQPLVRRSYAIPLETFEINVTGTVNVLEAVRKYVASGKAPRVLPVVVVTTDKVYENLENGRRYRETDRLGGRDPYSSSKAMAEQVVASYRQSFFQNGPVRLVSARAGNVIGGGDWAEDRIVPDAMRALARGNPILVRNQNSVRPWQHVLDPLSGYLTLGAALVNPKVRVREPGFRTQNSGFKKIRNPQSRNPYSVLSGAYNFGPNRDANRTVRVLVEEILKNYSGKWKKLYTTRAPHEAWVLQLSNHLARKELIWQPIWSFKKSVLLTIEWYLLYREHHSHVIGVTKRHIQKAVKIMLIKKNGNTRDSNKIKK